MANALASILNIIAPKKKAKTGGTSLTSTYNSQQTERALTLPAYQDHLTDVFATRSAEDSRALLKLLFKTDPDVSAAVNSYLTMANTKAIILVRDMEGEIDKEQTKALMKAITYLTMPVDYTLGFQLKPSLESICEELRYMLLLRGAIGTELILDKTLGPAGIRNVDMATVQWYEKKPGEYKPVQKTPSNEDEISLDIPTFWVAYYRRDPTNVYSDSTFVSAINTIAARQQVINDLYRIMQKTGYPRMSIKVIEEVLMKNMPANLRMDEKKKTEWVNQQMNAIRASYEGVRADQAFVHSDVIEPGVMNEKNPGVGIDITNVVETLNAQNQAGLKTMSTVIGRGTQGVNTSSVEARIAAMNADEINFPVAEVLSRLFSFILHNSGYQGFAEVTFAKAELRPDTELEPQLALKSARLRQDLSDGIITDMEYHLMMYGRLPPDSAPELSGTDFMTPEEPVAADGSGDVSPNGNSLGKSAAGTGSKNPAKQARSNSTPKKRPAAK